MALKKVLPGVKKGIAYDVAFDANGMSVRTECGQLLTVKVQFNCIHMMSHSVRVGYLITVGCLDSSEPDRLLAEGGAIAVPMRIKSLVSY